MSEIRVATTKTLIKRLQKVQARLAADRDELRDLKTEVKMLLEDKDEDIEALERVIDSLSRYV